MLHTHVKVTGELSGKVTGKITSPVIFPGYLGGGGVANPDISLILPFFPRCQV